MLSAFSVQRCPPSRWNTVRHQHGIVSAIAWNTQSKLLDLFEHAMKSVATTLVREARFDTSDFATAKQANCDGYQLTLQRLQVDGRDVWQGQFSRAEQRLTVIASLE